MGISTRGYPHGYPSFTLSLISSSQFDPAFYIQSAHTQSTTKHLKQTNNQSKMKVSIVALSLLSVLVSGLATPEVAPRQVQIYRPTLAVNIKQEAPNTAFGPTTTGIVSRSNGPKDIQTLLSFSLPALPGKTCTLVFSDPIRLSGTQRMQIFDVGGPVTGTNTFLTRPFRNNYRCAMAVKPAGQGIAAVQDNVSCKFDCPRNATVLGFETVPAGDNVEITWNIVTAGLVIQAS